jgi:hypothetical protein
MTAENFNLLETILIERIESRRADYDASTDKAERDEIYRQMIESSRLLLDVITAKEYIAQVRKQTAIECLKGLTVVQ